MQDGQMGHPFASIMSQRYSDKLHGISMSDPVQAKKPAKVVATSSNCWNNQQAKVQNSLIMDNTVQPASVIRNCSSTSVGASTS